MTRIVRPGSMLGLIGGGQLGRLFVLAAQQMGYRVAVLDPDVHSPAAQVAALTLPATYDDADAVAELARNTAAVAVEFENVPVEVLEVAARRVPVFPQPHVMRIAQNRVLEKAFLDEHHFPIAPYRRVRSGMELEAAVRGLGAPAILKAAAGGYDGKGQVPIVSPREASEAWKRLGARDAVVEREVAFECELSVIVARSLDGNMATYGPIRNIHFDNILDSSRYPAGISAAASRNAVALACEVAQALQVTGLLCVELFLLEGDALWINELAPRPHNSGHLTMHACATSQYAQLARMLCGMPLGPTDLLRPAAMVNLLGKLWEHGEPAWGAGLAAPDTYLTLYGKRQASPRRKMGHLTALANTSREALATAEQARQMLDPTRGGLTTALPAVNRLDPAATLSNG